MLKAATKKPEEILKKIKESHEAKDFIEEARANPQIADKFMPKTEAQTFIKILSEKKEKEKIVKKNIAIKSFSPAGINEIKEILSSPKNVEISYLGSSKFSISAKGKDFKQANHQVLTAIEQIKNKAKERKLIFDSDEK
jgi:translation initiation factor 2 alpha subunit (eIF-2alpha)